VAYGVCADSMALTPGQGGRGRSDGVVGECGADLVDVGAVRADGFMQDLAGDVELPGPVGDVGGDFGVDLFRVAGTLGVVFVDSVEFVGFGCGFLRIVMLGHVGFLFPGGSGWLDADGARHGLYRALSPPPPPIWSKSKKQTRWRRGVTHWLTPLPVGPVRT